MEEKDLNSVDNIEVEPLSDDDLESVSGGCDINSCSGDSCSNGALQDLS
jgi:bacteriocin-like protein